MLHIHCQAIALVKYIEIPMYSICQRQDGIVCAQKQMCSLENRKPISNATVKVIGFSVYLPQCTHNNAHAVQCAILTLHNFSHVYVLCGVAGDFFWGLARNRKES